MRRLLLAPLPLLLAACGSNTPSSSPRPTAAPTPVVSDAGRLRCPEGSTERTAQLDSKGYVRFADLLVDWSEHRDTRVSLKRRTLSVLRPSGSVQEVVRWHVVTHSHPYGAPIWFVDRAVMCDPESSPSLMGAGSIVTPLVELRVGHCWVDPVTIDGARWDVAVEDQFGTGDRRPRGFSGHGVAWPAGDVMLYRDSRGATLTLVRAGGPWTVRRTPCD